MTEKENKFIDLGNFNNKGTLVIDVTDGWSGVATVIDARKNTNFGNIKVVDEGVGYYLDQENGDLIVYNINRP